MHILGEDNFFFGENKERRNFLRYPCKLSAYEIVADQKIGSTVDISQAGMRLKTFKKLTKNNTYNFLLNTPERKVHLCGTIANCFENYDHYLYGIKFKQLDLHQSSILNSYLSLQFKLKGPSSFLLPKNNTFTFNPNLTTYQDIPLNKVIGSEIAAWINNIDLGSTLDEFTRRYYELGDREKFIWQWGYAAAQLTTIDGVHDIKDVCKTKVATIMLNGLIDDLVDKFYDNKTCTLAHDILLREEASKTLLSSIKDKATKDYLNLIVDLWNFIHKRLESYPNHKQLKEIILFDYEQLFNAMRYAYLANTIKSYANLTEYFLYQPHNMNVMINSTIDLMNHQTFDIKELGKIRKIVWSAQKLARIANALATWRREWKEKDYSNPLFAFLNEQNITSNNIALDIDEFENEINQAKVINIFYKQWLANYNNLTHILKTLDLGSVNLNSYTASMPRLLFDFHLALDGYI